ncbi:MAG: PAS domain-containing protein [Eubacterium sp.]|nr:PAS domain-containing protein [Eubacterium sp.]
MKENQSQNQYAFSERVLRDMSSAVLVLDKKGRIVYVNGPAARMFEVNEGYREDGTRFSLITENDYNDSFNEAIFDALYHKEKTTVEKVPYMIPPKHLRHFSLRSAAGCWSMPSGSLSDVRFPLII